MNKIPVGIIGMSGYTGLELIKILLKHPVFEIAYLANTQGEGKLEDIHPSLSKVIDLPIHKANPKQASQSCKLLFLALPHKHSMEFAKIALSYKVKIIDLSADYRLNIQNYENNYHITHTDPSNLSKAVYGLVEYARNSLKNASLVANPGCYPTASLLGLLPFLPYIEPFGIFIDAKSGVSGAGKNPTDSSHYPHINENIFSYSPLSHRHQIEIEEKCSLIGNEEVEINFIPHLIPINRGMLVSIFARLKQDLDPIEILTKQYENEEFIRIKSHPIEVSNVLKTHFCDIFVKSKGKNLYINTAIDNLLRGASSQSVVNANIICDLEENLAIPKMG